MKKKMFLLVVAVFMLNFTMFPQIMKVVNIKNGTRIEYKLVHLLHNIDGKSNEGVIELTVDTLKKNILDVSVSVDVTTFNSGNSNRDSHAMEVIDAISFPTANFKSKSILQDINNIKILGDLTFHGITNEIVINCATDWASILKVKGTFEVSLTAFKVERPSLLFIPVSDLLSFSFSAEFELSKPD